MNKIIFWDPLKQNRRKRNIASHFS